MIKRLPLFCYQSVSVLALTLCLASPVQAADALQPRAEVNMRAGTERSILMTEFWAPLAQQSDRVLYGDLRLMGDNDENKEGNLGFGYRQISNRTNSVLGANAWIDRRRTENGNNFHQVTIGVESLGETVDIRTNGYIQLNDSKIKATPNIGSVTPYLAGSGIFFDTNGFIVEEPQHGFDAEIGYRLPIFQKHIDATRVYTGGYHFFGDITDNTTGFRIRTEAQVNSIFSVGARFQHDGPRGSQGFLEATLRFPFSAKKSFQTDGLRSRLDESPERDIDIVNGTKVDTGLMKPVLNTSGTEQRILYVDNTNTNVGDGTKDNPFNTLKAAEAALQANDILYINRGDGTTTGMDQGIVIDKANVQLIGSGSALTYNGVILLSEGQAPSITNTQASVDNFTGNGITGLSDNLLISGVTVTLNNGNGIFSSAFGGQSFNAITISNVTATNNAKQGVHIFVTDDGTTLNYAEMSNIRAISNGTYGVLLNTSGTGIIVNEVNIHDIIANSQTVDGIRVQANGLYSVITQTNITNVTANNNAGRGVSLVATGRGTLDQALVSNISAIGNANAGVHFRVDANSLMNSGSLINATLLGNGVTSYGLQVSASSGTIGNFTGRSVIANNNDSAGIIINPSGTGSMDNVTLSEITTSNNNGHGIYASVSTSSATLLNNLYVSNSTANNNGSYGLYVNSNGGVVNNVVINNIITHNNIYGLYLYAQNTASVINSVSIANSDFIGNTSRGIYIRKADAAGVLNVDLGGGAANSAGQNRLFDNGVAELFVSYAGGGTLFARNNWWGTIAGPINNQEAGGAVIDGAFYLTADPRP